MTNNQVLKLTNVELCNINLKGERSKYNNAGKRQVTIKIRNEDLANSLLNDGWPVKSNDVETNEDKVWYLKVTAHYPQGDGKGRPPVVCKINSKGEKTYLDETTIGEIDKLNVINAQIAIRPYNWSFDGDTGVTAYLKTLYVEIEEDEFEEMYANKVKTASNIEDEEGFFEE